VFSRDADTGVFHADDDLRAFSFDGH